MTTYQISFKTYKIILINKLKAFLKKYRSYFVCWKLNCVFYSTKNLIENQINCLKYFLAQLAQHPVSPLSTTDCRLPLAFSILCEQLAGLGL